MRPPKSPQGGFFGKLVLVEGWAALGWQLLALRMERVKVEVKVKTEVKVMVKASLRLRLRSFFQI
ncbi:hypothetical protein [Marinilabilia sp.]|uniref:hypothetical protein n=1 Tax=Marinilabilia sp. TaxID=2021252 RepID=UPI0025BAF17B|nr:hypothetical protein [Marinilabilia sp.]